MKKILLVIFLVFTFTINAQSIDSLMYRGEVIERLERIEDAISGINLPYIHVNKPQYRSVGHLKNNAGTVEVDVANIRNDYQGIFTSTIRFNYADGTQLTKEKKQYKFVEIGSVFICDESSAEIQPTSMTWVGSKGDVVKRFSGSIKPLQYKDFDSQFLSAYKFICRKK